MSIATEALVNIFGDKKLKEEFAALKSKTKDKFKLAKLQEDFIISHSNGVFTRLKNSGLGKDYNNAKNKIYGDFKDTSGNYYDLRVGKGKFAGSITQADLKAFSNTATDKHFYICLNSDGENLYVISANKLLETIKKEDWFTDKNNKKVKFVGELYYQKKNFKKYL